MEVSEWVRREWEGGREGGREGGKSDYCRLLSFFGE